MKEEFDLEPSDSYDSWETSVTDDLERSNRKAWLVAMIAGAIALLEAIALIILLPLKTVEPYTLLVDRQTGNVEKLDPLDAQTIAPDAALTRSFLVQYVIARESFDRDDLQSDYRKTALWSAGDARKRYVALMQASNPASPVSSLPTGTTIRTEVKSVSSLGENRSMVRFSTTRVARGSQPQTAQHWVAIIDYTFSNAEMTEADRLLNPLGFQVTRYRRDAETLVDESYVPSTVDVAAPVDPLDTVIPRPRSTNEYDTSPPETDEESGDSDEGVTE